MSSSPSRKARLLAFLTAATALAVLAGTATAHTDATGSVARAACGSGTYFRLKTFSDPARMRVNMNPKDTTLEALGALARSSSPATRSSAFTRQVWQVTAQVTNFKLDSDGNVRMVLFSGTSYMNVLLPSGRCLSSASRARSTIAATRAWFVKNCGAPAVGWKASGAEVKLSGVGFWSPSSSDKGEAANRAELAPVIGMHPLAGCGVA